MVLKTQMVAGVAITTLIRRKPQPPIATLPREIIALPVEAVPRLHIIRHRVLVQASALVAAVVLLVTGIGVG